MLLKITLLLTCIICAAEANPYRPDCNLLGTSGTNNGANVMTLTSIMGATPTDATLTQVHIIKEMQKLR